MKKVIKYLVATTLAIFISLCLFACNKTEEKTFSVSFEANGGEAPATISTKLLTEFPQTAREGYILEGWYGTDDFSGSPVIFPYEPMQDTKLYARWYTQEEGSPFLVYTLDSESDTYEVTGYNGKSNMVFIPRTYQEKSVTKIADGAFNVCDTVQKINISDTIETIGRAFFRCNNLQEITVNSASVFFKAIDGILYSFDSSSLISYPPAKNGDSFDIPETVTAVQNSALRFSRYLKEINISQNVETIEKYFDGCLSLQSINVEESNSYFKSIDGVLYSKDSKILLRYPQNYQQKEFELPEGITSVSDYAFDQSSVTSITIPASLENFSYIEDCRYLNTFVVHKDNQYYKSIDGVLFDNEGEILVQYPQAKKGEIYKYEGDNKEYYNYNIPGGTQTIKSWAFYSCIYLNKVTVSSTVKEISEYAFTNIESIFKLKEVVFQSGSELEKVGDFAFMDCNLSELKLTAIVPPQLGNYVFNGTDENFTIYVPTNTIDIYQSSKWNNATSSLVAGGMEQLFTTKFYTNGGVALDDIRSAYIAQALVPLRSGYVFGGWFNNASLVGEKQIFPLKITDDTSLYAKWYLDIQGTQGLSFSLQSATDTYTVSGYTGVSTEIEIPPTYNGKIVTIIGSSAFANKTHITSVVLPETIEEIRDSAFAGNYNNIMRIESIAFPNKLKTIGNYAFQYCQKLNNISLPPNLEIIGNGAFNNCVSLERIDIPSKTHTIGFYAFSTCARLTQFTTGINPFFSSLDGVLYNFDKTVLIKYPAAKQNASFVLPQEVVSIASEAFYLAKNLIDIELNEGLTEIGTRAFYYCNGLETVALPTSMTAINPAVFRNSKLKEIYLSESVIAIEDNFNSLDYLENIYVDTSNNNYKSIDGVLYSKDGKTLIRYPMGRQGMFTLPALVEEIAAKAFYECIISEIEFNEQLNIIGNEAFYACSELGAITIPENLSVIGDYAFMHAKKLRALFLSSTNIPQLGSYSFAGVDSSFTVYSPDEIIDDLALSADWSSFQKVSNSLVTDGLHLLMLDGYYKLIKVLKTDVDIVIPPSIGVIEIRIIGKNAFASNVRRVFLPYTITQLESFAFESNIDSNLTTVIFEENSNLHQIGANAFYNCRMLSSLVLGSDIPPYVAGESTILELKNHMKIYVPDTLEYVDTLYSQLSINSRNVIVGDFAIEESDEDIIITAYIGADTEIVFPTTINNKTVALLGEYIINPTIKRVVVPDTIIELQNNAFSAAIYNTQIHTTVMALDSITINSTNLQTIGERAFQGLSIQEISLPENLQTIAPSAFESCYEITKINVDAANNNYSSLSGILFNYDMTKLIKYPVGSLRMEYSVPDSVEIIGESAFAEANNLIIINFNENLMVIESYAFENCSSLLDMTLPSGILRLESFAFKGSYRINSLYLPSTLEDFNATVVLDCSSLATLNTSALSENYTAINGVIFDKSHQTIISYPAGKKGAYTIPSSVKFIAPYAFYATQITNITIPNEVIAIGEYAFANSSIITIAFGNGVSVLSESILKDCQKLENLSIPNSVTEIGESFAEGCMKLRNFEFPSSIESIGNRAFAECRLLTNITIPEGLLTLGNEVFNNCTNLTSIILPMTASDIGESLLKGSTALISIKMGVNYTINYLFGSLAGVIPVSLKIITIQEGVGILPEGFFSHHTNIQTVILPSTLTQIKKNAFYECLSLTTIDIKGGSRIETIEEKAFWNCKELSVFKINRQYPPMIGSFVFYGDINGNTNKLPKLKVYVPNSYVFAYQTDWEVDTQGL